MPDFAALLEELSRGYRLVLLSNVDRYYFEAIRHLHPELGYFATQLVSYEMGFSKPSTQAKRTIRQTRNGSSAKRSSASPTALIR